MTETHKHETRAEVRREVTLPAGRQAVWEALTEPELLEQWLADEVELDLREGGEAIFRYRSGEERRGWVEELAEEERLRLRWRREGRDETGVDFVLADAAAGTRLVVVESTAARESLMLASAWEDPLFELAVLSLGRGSVLVA